MSKGYPEIRFTPTGMRVMSKFYWWVYHGRVILKMGVCRRNSGLNRWIRWAHKQGAQLAYVYSLDGAERASIIEEENAMTQEQWEKYNA